MMNNNRTLGWMSATLATVGALNWGLVGLARFDLVKALFGRDTFVTRLVYGLVGLAGVWSVYRLFTAAAGPAERREMMRRVGEAA